MRHRASATILAATALAIAVTAITGCAKSGQNAADEKLIIIGGDFATSGGDASAGVPTQNGAVLAIEDQAKIGLPGGYTLRAQMEDDTVGGVHDEAQGVRNVQALLEDPHVLVIVGPQNSSVARAEIPVANQAKIALISPTTTSIGLTDDAAGAAELRRDNPTLHTFFRTVLRDDLQGSADANFAFTRLHARRAYVIDDNQSYGKGIADVFARSFARLGGVVVDRAHLSAAQQDFIPLLTRVEGAHPDLVYYGGVVSTGGALLRRQMVKLAMKATFMGGDGIKEQGFIDGAGAASEGVYCSDGAPDLDALPSAAHFLKAYAARFPGQPVGTYSANAYAAAQVAVETIRHLMEKNGGVAPTREQVARAVAASVTPDTPLGSIAFTHEGDVTTPVVSMWVIRKGAYVFIEQERKALR
jgi:branched-chain amino acid transport system substrate-binding protein